MKKNQQPQPLNFSFFTEEFITNLCIPSKEIRDELFLIIRDSIQKRILEQELTFTFGTKELNIEILTLEPISMQTSKFSIAFSLKALNANKQEILVKNLRTQIPDVKLLIANNEKKVTAQTANLATLVYKEKKFALTDVLEHFKETYTLD